MLKTCTQKKIFSTKIQMFQFFHVNLWTKMIVYPSVFITLGSFLYRHSDCLYDLISLEFYKSKNSRN